MKEIEQMEISQRISIYNREIDLREKKRILYKLDIAESFNFAYLGSQPDKRKENIRQYKKWRNDYYRQLNPDAKTNNIWGYIPRKGKF